MAIQCSELRIGNYIGLSDKLGSGNVKIEALKFGVTGDKDRIQYKGNLIWNILEDFEPIPVTYELLIDNCGFNFKTNKTYGKHFYLKRKGETKIVLFKNSWYDAAVKDSPFHVFYSGLEVKYLHQLQNLIFALTGQEIQYNP